MQSEVNGIARRHVRRCLGQIEQVHNLPELCRVAIRKEMHFCANDVLAMLNQGDQTDADEDTKYNR